MVLFERQTGRPSSRFGGLSTNMFFTRNSPQPLRVRHIEGLNGAMICNVNDDLTRNRPKRTNSLNFNKNNLPTFEKKRRVERLVPPMDFWHVHGIIPETEHWKEELAALATASGVGLEKDDQKQSNKLRETADHKYTPRSGAHYSRRTGRFNEGTPKSRGRTNTKHGTTQSDILFNVSENEREMWMLQVLCQLLDTSNLEDVQSWLVSASPAEKEQARSMINAALRGLKESERASHQAEESVDLDSLSNFVEKQKNEEKNASQKYINDTLNRSAPVLPYVDEQQEQQEQQPESGLNDTWDTSGVHKTYSFASNNKTDPFNENEQNVNEDHIDTIQLDDDRRRPQSASLTKPKKLKNYQSPRDRPSSSLKQKSNVESIQFNDDDDAVQNLNYTNEIKNQSDNNEHEHYQSKDIFSSSNKTDLLPNQSDDKKSRKIRELQNKLTRQEEESKKKFEELQTKQSRLENAIRLLAKQSSSRKNRRQETSDQLEDLDAPVVNVIIQSPRETERRERPTKTRTAPFIHADGKSKKNRENQNGSKLGDYNVEDVKVQISLSRLDNHQPKVYGGVWKPDAQTLQRLQGY